MKVFFLFPMFLMSCASIDGISAMARSAGYDIDTSKTIAFFDAQFDDENLIAYDSRKKFVDACLQTAKSKNLKVEPLSVNPKNPDIKYVAFLTYEVSSRDYQTNVPAYTTPVYTNCTSGAFGSINCNSSGGHVYGGYSINQTIFAKLLNIEIFNFEDLNKKSEKPKAIKQIRAVVTSNDSAIKPGTANVLCRAAFADFPNNIENTEYYITNPESPSMIFDQQGK